MSKLSPETRKRLGSGYIIEDHFIGKIFLARGSKCKAGRNGQYKKQADYVIADTTVMANCGDRRKYIRDSYLIMNGVVLVALGLAMGIAYWILGEWSPEPLCLFFALLTLSNISMGCILWCDYTPPSYAGDLMFSRDKDGPLIVRARRPLTLSFPTHGMFDITPPQMV